MSYILEALRKSERERQSKQSPGIDAVVADTPQPKRVWLPWALVGALVVLNGLAVGFFVLRDHRTATQEPIAASTAQTALPASNAVENRNPLPAGEGRVRAEAPDVSTSLPQVPSASGPHPHPSPAGEGLNSTPLPAGEGLGATALPPVPVPNPPVQVSVPRLASPNAVESDNRLPPGVARVRENGPAQPAALPQAADHPARGAPLPQKPEGADSVVSPPSHPVGTRRPAPLRVEAQIPSQPKPVEKPPKPRPAETVADKQPVEDQDGGSHAYRINVIAYASAPEERFAIIDMTRYITGDRLPDGAVVEAIEQNGVVLKRNGRLIRIRH